MSVDYVEGPDELTVTGPALTLDSPAGIEHFYTMQCLL